MPETKSDKTEQQTAPSAAQQPVVVQMIQPDRAAEGARAIQEGRDLEMDKTIPGGRYRLGDQLVDANGEPIRKSADDKD